jgi:hypothetical protein
MLFITAMLLCYVNLSKKGVLVTQDFGDFDEQDTMDDGDVFSDVDWDSVTKLQAKYDEVNVIVDPEERKLAAKALVRELNGDDSGPILVT